MVKIYSSGLIRGPLNFELIFGEQLPYGLASIYMVRTL